MIIKLTHKSKSFDVDVEKSCDLKLYSVPKEYSEDGYYISQYGYGDIEPAPACAGKDAKLLCHASVSLGTDGSAGVNINISEEGASCHA